MESVKLEAQFPHLILPKDYHPSLDALATAHALQQIKSFIELNLETEMKLHRISAPLFVKKGTGINDDLNGIEKPVSFTIKEINNLEAEVVQSLAKWKRMALAEYNLPIHEGIYTDMHAIRADEEPDNIHSFFVDQWDWEMRIRPSDRRIAFLKKVVSKLYSIFKRTETFVHKQYGIEPDLPEEIHFIHSEELLQEYPDISPSEREHKAVEKYGAVFIMGIGGELSNGLRHDGRSPDYDDWSTENEDGYFGLNGDILIWNRLLNCPVELSSMGIRVDRESLLRQLDLRGKNNRKELLYHSMLLNNELPLSIGGGIGQSRTGMYFLRKAHIGEINAGIWPEEMIKICREHNIRLL